MKGRRYYTVGVLIVAILMGLVTGVRAARGMPRAIEMEPWKIQGNPEAPVFIVEFSDFACPYCNKIRPPLKEVLDAYPQDLKLIFKHFPLSIHPPARPAAEAAECAADQGKFWPYHDLLFSRVKEWYRTKDLTGMFVGFAAELGMDPEKFRTCLESGAKKAAVEQNKKEGRNVFVSGTPTLLLNGRKVFTSHKADSMKDLVRREIERSKKR